MSADFAKYLATEIISEQRTLSYRNVARACKVHANTAKCMLYEFYDNQNKRKPASLYATYVIAGVKRQEEPIQNGSTNGVFHSQDEPVPSSPPAFTSSMLEPSQRSEGGMQASRMVISLVREERLDDVKAQYESVSSIHIYSLSPTKLQDLVTLVDVGRGLYAEVFAKEDPLLHNKTYGVIQNPQVRRRKGKRPAIPSAPPTKFQPVQEQLKSAAKPSSASNKEETTSRPSSRGSTSTHEAKPAPLKRGASDLFKAFAKSQPPKPKNDSQNTTMSDAPTSKLSDNDEGESEDEALFLDTGTRQPAKKRASDIKKEREDKAAKLRKMMDSDDDEAAAVPKVEDAAAEADGPVAAKKLDGDDENDRNVVWSDSEGESVGKKHGAAPAEQGGPRRRRGKRKVMKKRTMKDEDGYLVTKEEPVWESFSESEPEVEKKLAAKAGAPGVKSQNSSQKSGTAAGKGSAKKGKGDIMSFFGKK